MNKTIIFYKKPTISTPLAIAAFAAIIVVSLAISPTYAQTSNMPIIERERTFITPFAKEFLGGSESISR